MVNCCVTLGDSFEKLKAHMCVRELKNYLNDITSKENLDPLSQVP